MGGAGLITVPLHRAVRAVACPPAQTPGVAPGRPGRRPAVRPPGRTLLVGDAGLLPRRPVRPLAGYRRARRCRRPVDSSVPLAAQETIPVTAGAKPPGEP